jgi:type 1 glutamine amidotransferase
VFSRTGGYRHASIPLGIATIEQLGEEHGFAVEASEEPSVFTDRNLRRFTAVAFLNTTAEVMTPAARTALRRFVLAGGGWAGIHSAADTEYDWPFCTRLLAGGRFLAHPLEQPGVVVRESTRHISTRHVPARWEIPLEEFYSFTSNPRARARVLLSIDESTYQQDPNTSHLPSEEYPDGYEPVSGVMGDHPMCWQHRVGGGLSWYTALGHEVNMYLDPAYRQHLLGGLLTVTRHGRRHLPG